MESVPEPVVVAVTLADELGEVETVVDFVRLGEVETVDEIDDPRDDEAVVLPVVLLVSLPVLDTEVVIDVDAENDIEVLTELLAELDAV